MDETVEQIVWASCMILRLLVGPLTMLHEVCICCYIFICLLSLHFPLVEALCSQVVDTIDEYFSLFSIQMATSNSCAAFTYYVSCITGTYLKSCVKDSETDSVSDP